ncbi:MAG: RloB domain-containing protein [Bacteroidia bacterium]|nr:RloB domain-containing protein [Bacteroidia bacterium]
MGTDNLFHIRKAQRTAASLKRSKDKQRPYDRVLIVCEGEKTEPSYIQDVRDDLRLSSANIVVCGKECGSDPVSVVNYALEKFRKDSDYNRIYCVMDRDCHVNFSAAIDKIQRARLGKNCKIFAATSTPCFEFWLLLHYIYTSRQYIATAKKSVCDLVIEDLKKLTPLKNYEKGNKKIYSITKEKISTAIMNAKRLQIHHKAAGTDSPDTLVHELLSYLMEIKTNKAV